MLGLYTKKQLEQRMDDHFDVLLDYLEVQDALIEDLYEEVDEMLVHFDAVLRRSSELILLLNEQIEKKSIKKAVSKKSSKK